MKKLLEKYNFKDIENEIRIFWKNNNVSQSNLKDAKNFTIVIPPPNVTGHLHLGHAWDGIIQDSIIRYKRLQGFNSIWIPGTDHAGIATQVKFEKYLKDNNLDKDTLGKEKFISELNKWKDSQSNFIHDQWNEMGFLLDYSKEKFTLDDSFSNAVINAFVKLYKANLIYEGYRLVNWDTKLKTAISDIEVIHKETKSKFYYINYDVIDINKKIIDKLLIATTRPETMFGDVCVVINPNDLRLKKYKDCNVINPANGDVLPIIYDDYVDINFGTGVMKCTPAHDFNDYNIAKKHDLKIINIMNDDGTLNDNVPLKYRYKKIEDARVLLVEELNESKHLDHIEDIINNIGYSERTGVLVQPYLTKQWFLKTSELAKDVIATQQSNNKVYFLPERFENTLMHWLLNMEDWCISRQLWWGHQLPVWYNNKTNEVYCDVIPPKNVDEWTRSSDVLDTWFSSGLWPLIASNWDGKSNEIKGNLFPTQILVTGYDIIFFWIARMMMFSSYFIHESPFNYVYIHGLVKDEYNRKMSKSLGNGIEPKEVINEYGNDALRIFFLSDSAAGEDISFKPARLKQSFNFLIKVWNTAKFIEYKKLEYDENFEVVIDKLNFIELWILQKLQINSQIVKNNLDKYNFNIAYKYLSDFIWNDFCNFYLECFKNSNFDNNNSHQLFLYIWKNILIMLQSFTPFISEYLYQKIYDSNSSILNVKWLDKFYDIDEDKIHYVDLAVELLNKIRNIRNDINLPLNQKIEIKYDTSDKDIVNQMNLVLNLSNSEIIQNIDFNGFDAFIFAIENNKFTLKIPKGSIQEYIYKLEHNIQRLENELERSKKILNNPDFLNKASKTKIELEEDKFKKYKQEFEMLKKEKDELNF